MPTRRASAGAILAALTSSAPASSAVREATDFSVLAKAVDSAVADKHLPSVVAVVFDEHRILWSRTAGYADITAKRAPTLRTRYRLGSMAKAVTSTVLAVAEQKGLVSFDTPVRLMTAEGRRRISIRNVVNMEAGLAQAVCYEGIAGSADADCDAGFDRRFAVAMTGGRGRYSYSNMGPQLAADALAMRVRRPFEQVARDLLFVPGGMDEATYEHSRKAKSRVADYERDGKTFGHDFLILPPAGAGLEGSARDLVRFGQLHLTGRSANSRQLLSAGTLARLHSAPNGGFYGFGWGRIGAGKPTELLISDGQVNGGQAMLLINPARGVGALVMSNAAHDEVSELALKAVDTVVPGVSAAFAADVDKAQAAHVAQIRAFLPPAEFKADGFLRVGGHQFPITATGHRDRLIISIAGRLTEQVQSEEDEGFRGWEVPCPSEIPACSRPGAKAKLWLSRDAGALGGQLQVTSLNGQLPYAVRLRLH